MIRFFFCTALLVILCSSPACAGKEGAAASRAKAPRVAAVSASALDDIVRGLSDFERRASRFDSDEWNLVLGYGHYRAGRWGEAEALFAKAAPAFPQISDHLLFFRAVCAERLKKPADAIAFLDELEGSVPDSVWGLPAKLERGRALVALGRQSEARSILTAYRREVDADRAFDAATLIAQSYIDEGDGDGASAFVRSLAVGAGSEAKLAELAGLMEDCKRRFHSDVAAWLDEGPQQLMLSESFVASSQWDEAVVRLERLLARRQLERPLTVQAKWLLARCYRGVHRYDDAIRLMEELEGLSDARGIAHGLQSTLATTYTKGNAYAKAIALRQRMAARAKPGSPQAAEAAYKIAFLVMDEGKYAEAIPLWRAALAVRGGGRQEQAEWYLAWCTLRSQDVQGARSLFDAMLAGRTKRSAIHDRLLYWQGRALFSLGQAAEARAVFAELFRDHPNGYYAELARRRLRGGAKDAADLARALGDETACRGDAAAAASAMAGEGHFGRALVFDRLGLHEEAARELRASSSEGDADAVMALAARNFAHDVAYRIAEGGYHSLLQGAPGDDAERRRIWESAYPKAYAPLVEQLVRGSVLDARFVWAIMRNESAFRPEVVSPAGAVGLLQLMPTTANRYASALGQERVDRRDLSRPAVNAALGVAYLQKLAELFPKNPVAWMASYNAGEEAVERWIKNGRIDDIEAWIEEIPYDETNLYVKKVLLSYWRYQRLYPEGA